MPTDDEPFDELERYLGLSRPEPLPARGRKKKEPAKAPVSRRGSLPPREPHPLAPVGPKLKALREASGWMVDEIADRTGVPLATLAAFEEGDSDAAAKVSLSDLERLASACCGSAADLITPEQRREVRRKEMRRTTGGSFFDPFSF